VLLAAACSAVGLAASSLSQSQMVGAAVSWCILIFLWIVGFLDSFEGIPGAIGESLGMIAHFEKLTKGLVQTPDLAFFALLIFLFLLIAQQRVQAHRWR
jgi:ABC-2 type transport system permease protein